MQISQYIIVKKKSGYRGYASRMTKSSPALASNEVAVKVMLELPDAIFEKPTFEAKVVVPKDAISKPVIEAEVVDNVQDIIKQNTGFDVKLEVVEPEE